MIMKKIFVILLIVFIHSYTVEAELSNEAIKSVGHFLMLDFYTNKSESGEKREPLTRYFFVKETKDTWTITKDKIEELKGFGNEIIINAGTYKEILIINEVSGLGGIKRIAYINESNQVFWSYDTHSLMHFEFQPKMGFIEKGVPQIMGFDAEYLSKLFKDC